MCCFFFFKQKTAYEMRISDWSSDVCSSDLATMRRVARGLKRYVIDAAEPFIVPATHHGSDRMRGLSEPMPTVTAAHRGEQMLVSPILAGVGGSAGGSAPDRKSGVQGKREAARQFAVARRCIQTETAQQNIKEQQYA